MLDGTLRGDMKEKCAKKANPRKHAVVWTDFRYSNCEGKTNMKLKNIAFVAFLVICGGVLIWILSTDYPGVMVEYNGSIYTVKEYNHMMYKRVQAEQVQKEAEKRREEQTETERKRAKFLTLIDDDGYNTFTEKLLPVIQEKSISISMAIETGNVGTGEFMSWEAIANNYAAGAEVLNHSKLHIYSAEESEKRDKDEIKEEMLESKQMLIEHGYADTADIYVYPGASAGSTWSVAQQVFRVGINSSGSEVNQMPFSQFNMHRYPVGSTHVPSFAEMKGYIDELVESEGGWEIWMMHSNNGYMTEEYIEALKQVIDYCEEVGVQIVSVKYALDFYDIQKIA